MRSVGLGSFMQMLCSREEGPAAAWWPAGQAAEGRALGRPTRSPGFWPLQTQMESQPGPPRPGLGERGDHQALWQDPQKSSTWRLGCAGVCGCEQEAVHSSGDVRAPRAVAGLDDVVLSARARAGTHVVCVCAPVHLLHTYPCTRDARLGTCVC